MHRTGRTGTAVGRLIDAVYAVLVGTAALLTLAGVLFGVGRSSDPQAPPVPVAGLIDAERLAFEDGEVEQLARQALSGISYPWQSALPGWTIEFRRGDSEIAGYTWSREQRIEVFVRPGDDGQSVTRVLAHELGHAVDVTLNNADERRDWLAERGIDANTPWWPTSGAADFATGAGDFAEAFAAWQTGADDFRSRLAGPPDPTDLELLVVLAEG